jgi:hypothetical protein
MGDTPRRKIRERVDLSIGDDKGFVRLHGQISDSE